MIFVIGHSKTGKSPVAQRIANHYGYPVIEAGAWARALCPAKEGEMSEEYVPRVSQAALEALKNDPRISVRHVVSHLSTTTGPCLIVGIRNPFDFANLVDPTKDHVIFIESDVPLSDFEQEGITLIQGMVKMYATVFRHPPLTLRAPHPDTHESWGIYLDKMAEIAIRHLGQKA